MEYHCSVCNRLIRTETETTDDKRLNGKVFYDFSEVCDECRGKSNG